MDRTELAFRLYYAKISLRDWVSVYLRTHVFVVVADTIYLPFSLCPIAPQPDWTATRLPMVIPVVAC